MSKKQLSNVFVGVVFLRYDTAKRPQVLVIPSRWAKFSGSRVIIKSPGGMHKSTDLDFLATARREARAETGLKIKQSANPLLLGSFMVDDQWKYFYLITESQFKGRIRRRIELDGDTELGVPYWVTLEELESQLHRTHRPLIPKLKQAILSMVA